jgi:hypothetical protein
MTAAEACLKLVEELPGKGADNLRAAIHSEWRSAPLSMRGYLGYNPERVVWNSESGGYGAETIIGCGARSALGAGPQRPEKKMIFEGCETIGIFRERAGRLKPRSV